jgi:hypothetical protein
MRKTLTATLTALLLALGLALASPATAASGLCWVGGDSAARLSVTKYYYGVVGGRDTWQYHMDMNSHGLYTKYRMYINGVALPSTEDQYSLQYAGTHTVKGTWMSYPLGEAKASSCSVTL